MSSRRAFESKNLSENLWQLSGAKPKPSSEAALPVHGFVFLKKITDTHLFDGKHLTETFSDAVVPVAIDCFYGSLKNTLSYFKTAHHLVERTNLEASYLENSSDFSVVFTPDILAGYLYGRLKCSGIKAATRDNIDFHTFKKNISWDDWVYGVASFSELLAITKSDQRKAKSEITKFAETMHQLRFQSPSEVTSSFTRAEIQRRFGLWANLFWEAWVEPSQVSLPKFVEVSESVNTRSFETFLHEVVEPERLGLLLIDEAKPYVMQCIHKCLEKIFPLSSLSSAIGVRDFRIEITFNDRITVEKNVTLSLPIFELSKIANTILLSTLDSLMRFPTELPSAKEESFFIKLQTVEDVKIVPLTLVHKRKMQNRIFQTETESLSREEIKKLIEAKDGSKVKLFKLTARAAVNQSYAEVNDENKAPDFEDSFPDLSPVHRYRPCFLFKNKLKICLHTLRTQRKIAKIVYCETDGDRDYYCLDIVGAKQHLWISSLLDTRKLGNFSRSFQIEGLMRPARVN